MRTKESKPIALTAKAAKHWDRKLGASPMSKTDIAEQQDARKVSRYQRRLNRAIAHNERKERLLAAQRNYAAMLTNYVPYRPSGKCPTNFSDACQNVPQADEQAISALVHGQTDRTINGLTVDDLAPTLSDSDLSEREDAASYDAYHSIRLT